MQIEFTVPGEPFGKQRPETQPCLRHYIHSEGDEAA